MIFFGVCVSPASHTNLKLVAFLTNCIVWFTFFLRVLGHFKEGSGPELLVPGAEINIFGARFNNQIDLKSNRT